MTESSNAIRGLYAIADTGIISAGDLLEAVAAAITGGARTVQYRDKSGGGTLRLVQARALATLCRDRGATFIVNDDPSLAHAAGADGVHIGREDGALAQARTRLGAAAIIGVSCYNDLERAVAAETKGADYVAFGSFFTSPTKPDAVHANLDLLRRARARLALPIVAIGGIRPDNGGALVEAGADALAVVSGVFAHRDIRAAAGRYAGLFK